MYRIKKVICCVIVLAKGEITAKEEQLWQFVVANYGISDFSTKQLEKDFGNAPTQPFALLC